MSRDSRWLALAAGLGLFAPVAAVDCGAGDDETAASSATVTASSGPGSASVSGGGSPASSGVGGGDAGSACQNGETCNGSTGLCNPIVACSTAAPCDSDAGALTSPIDLPVCKTTNTSHPVFDDGPPREWLDAVSGEQRAACVYRPAGASSTSKRPLVVFLHGSSGSADDVYDHTLLRAKAASFDLSGDPQRPGFALASDQGRNLPNPNGNLGAAARHDIYYRDLGSPSQNPDIRNLDRLIDELVAEGDIDGARIYLVGWSNGGFFSQLYAISRHETATLGGARVAGAIAYAGADPFQNISDTESPSCKFDPYPTSSVAIGLFHRTCDSAVGCDAAQQQKFSMPPGYDVTTWAQTLGGAVNDPNVANQLFDAGGQAAAACTSVALCGKLVGLSNHIRWPDGLATGDTVDWEGAMLDFLRAHPHP